MISMANGAFFLGVGGGGGGATSATTGGLAGGWGRNRARATTSTGLGLPPLKSCRATPGGFVTSRSSGLRSTNVAIIYRKG